MTFKLRHLVAAVAVASTSLGAVAATIPLGTNPSSASLVGFGLSSTPVPWSYSFTLDSTTDLSNLFLSLRSTDPVDYAISLTGPTASTIAITGGTLIPATYTFNSLADGAYVLSIIGTPTSSWSASYGRIADRLGRPGART